MAGRFAFLQASFRSEKQFTFVQFKLSNANTFRDSILDLVSCSKVRQYEYRTKPSQKIVLNLANFRNVAQVLQFVSQSYIKLF